MVKMKKGGRSGGGEVAGTEGMSKRGADQYQEILKCAGDRWPRKYLINLMFNV